MDFAPGSSRKSPGAFSCLARLQRSLPRSGIASRGEVGEEPTRQGPACFCYRERGFRRLANSQVTHMPSAIPKANCPVRSAYEATWVQSDATAKLIA